MKNLTVNSTNVVVALILLLSLNLVACQGVQPEIQPDTQLDTDTIQEEIAAPVDDATGPKVDEPASTPAIEPTIVRATVEPVVDEVVDDDEPKIICRTYDDEICFNLPPRSED